MHYTVIPMGTSKVNSSPQGELQGELSYNVDTCPLTKSEGGLNLLHEADDDSHVAGIYSDFSTR